MCLPSCLLVALLALQSNDPVGATAAPAEAVGASTATLAGQFAPVLVYHPQEEYLPVSPLFALDGYLPSGAGRGPDASEALKILGTVHERRDTYLSLDMRAKAKMATVYYRVNRLRSSITIDYWLYYVWNEYSAHPGVLPVWFDASHPNDLERIRVVLSGDPSPDSSVDGSEPEAARVEVTYVSAHDGLAPANRQYSTGYAGLENQQILVERGSHAGAPDTDRDGAFTPGVDGESGYKILWGVRDRGLTWSRYNPDYMDRRENGDAVWVCAAGAGASPGCPPGSFAYRLVPVEELYRQFEQLDLSREEFEQAFESKIGFLKRILGKSNGQADKLVLPPEPGEERNLDGFSASERGLMFGATTVGSDPGFFFGGRYSFLHGSKIIPDLVLQADPVLTIEGDGYFSSAALASYPLGAVTKVLAGIGFMTDFDAAQVDFVGGLEMKIGGFRVSLTGRTIGPVTRSAMDLRLYYFF